MARSGKSLKELQSALDDENPHTAGGVVLPGTGVKISTGVEHIKKKDNNIVAALPPTNGSDEYVVVGAHYDHLGMGSSSSSMARSGEENKVHPGADDNASGVATVMELAGSVAAEKTKPRRGIIFALWSGEEIGLIGSSAFCEHPPVPLSKIAAYVNFDMVGRLRDNRLSLQAVGLLTPLAQRDREAQRRRRLQPDPAG